jgi:hypothetical protein
MAAMIAATAMAVPFASVSVTLAVAISMTRKG